MKNNFFIQSLPVFKSGLFSMRLNQDIVDIEKPDGIINWNEYEPKVRV